MNIDKEGNFCYIPRNIIENENTSIEDCLMEVLAEMFRRYQSRYSVIKLVLNSLDRFLDDQE
jgi:hypothetical protein